MHLSSPRAFILPVVLGVAAIIVATVIVSAALLRYTPAAPIHQMSLARAEALYGLDIALAQLHRVASADTVATAPAAILGSVSHPTWVGAWAPGGAPGWLVSGVAPSPYISGGVLLNNEGLRASSVATPRGSYAYAISDASTLATQGLTDSLDAIALSFSDSAIRLRQQTMVVPHTATLSLQQQTPISFGLPTNPLSGGLKLDLDQPISPGAGDTLSTAVATWRDSSRFAQGRPLIWGEVALLMGVYRGQDSSPQLGLAFWADAWNPYTLSLPWNARGVADLRLRLSSSARGTIFYKTASGSLSGFGQLDLTSHTAQSPVSVDLYSTMKTGEIRFVWHFRRLPIDTQDLSGVSRVEVSYPAATWDFIFETLDGRPVQTISGVPIPAFSGSFPYITLPNAAENPDRGNAQWVFSFKVREPLDSLPKTVDLRAAQLAYSPNIWAVHSNPLSTQGLFSPADSISDGRSLCWYDLPEGSLVGAGSLAHMPLEGAGALGLGTAAGGGANHVLDSYFFSTLPPTDVVLGLARSPLPNPRLWLRSPRPSLTQLRNSPAAHMLVAGAFNINTADTAVWLAQLPTERYRYPFRLSSDTQGPVVTAVSVSQRSAWAQAIVDRLRIRGRPWPTLSDFAAEDLLPGDVLCRIAGHLQPRGDTMVVYVRGATPAATACLRATVQRTIDPNDTTQRTWQVVDLTWLEAPAL